MALDVLLSTMTMMTSCFNSRSVRAVSSSAFPVVYRTGASASSYPSRFGAIRISVSEISTLATWSASTICTKEV